MNGLVTSVSDHFPIRNSEGHSKMMKQAALAFAATLALAGCNGVKARKCEKIIEIPTVGTCCLDGVTVDTLNITPEQITALGIACQRQPTQTLSHIERCPADLPDGCQCTYEDGEPVTKCIG